ncbi:hypothetical protein CK203_081228 [Vitis vinifera]|uniref:Uncharacterized protein n=1 Tax=Vitis vinifera TaxID=29760 RepID=A0A438ERE3_VITVI|nr:hypothetical protein CK203_081228 [Vitis vinifera]
MIDTLVDEHCDQRMQEDLVESFGDLDEGLLEPSDLLATCPLGGGEKKFYPYSMRKRHKDLRKKAIGWQISDLKGISPLVCTHHIYMEDEAKPVRQPQRSPWVSPTQVVPKKSRITVMKMIREKMSLHVLERVSGHHFYCFLDGYSYFQIEIDVEDQEKTTFTCPFGTMHTGEWIVLGHIISKQDIEVDKAKVELIVKLPSPTNVKGVRQFFGHAEFYRRVQSLDQRQEGVENVVADHLSRLAIAHNSHGLPINDDFPEKFLMLVEVAP